MGSAPFLDLQGAIIQDFYSYLTGAMNIAVYLSWYKRKTQGVVSLKMKDSTCSIHSLRPKTRS